MYGITDLTEKMDPALVYPLLLNASNDTGSCQIKPQPVSINILQTLVFLLGFLLNSFSFWIFCCRIPSWHTGTTLQFHLALSDAIATPVTPMMAVYFAMGSDWRFGRVLCQLKIALLSSHFYGSTIFLTLISIHRYILVVHFNKSSRMKQKDFVRKVCAGVWIVLLVQAVVYALVLPPSKEGRNNQCLSIHQKGLKDLYFVINFILLIFGFILPFTVLAVFYGRLANMLTSRLNVSTASGLKVQMKSQRMICVCLMIFGLCFLPLNVTRTLGVIITKYYPQKCQLLRQVETAYYASWILAGVNSCLDPLLYCFGSKIFKVAFQSLRICQKERQNRNDSDTPINQ